MVTKIGILMAGRGRVGWGEIPFPRRNGLALLRRKGLTLTDKVIQDGDKLSQNPFLRPITYSGIPE